MGIPRKGGRKLVLSGGRKFIYMIREAQLEEEKVALITVQEDIDRPGRCMQFKYPLGNEMVPSIVALVVNEALENGWNPSERGSAFLHTFVGESD